MKKKKGIIKKQLGTKIVIKKLKTKSYFEPKSFRYVRVPKKGKAKAFLKVGCKKGKFSKGVCKVGTKAYLKITPKKNRSKNPLLMILPNTPNSTNLEKRNFLSAIQEYKRKFKIDPESYPKFWESVRQYKLQHGTLPTKFWKTEIPSLGSGKTCLVGLGKTDNTVYITPRHSQKGSKQPYIHNYRKMPGVYTDHSGKYLITLPKKGKLMKGGWITA